MNRNYEPEEDEDDYYDEDEYVLTQAQIDEANRRMWLLIKSPITPQE